MSRIFASVGAASTKTRFEMSPDIPTALKEIVAFIYFFVGRKTGNATLFKMRTDL
jgi:hypothetical protein